MQDRLKFRMFNKLIKKFSYFSLPELQVCLNKDFLDIAKERIGEQKLIKLIKSGV